MITKTKCDLRQVIFFLFILSPIVDNINGFLIITRGDAGISSLFKIIILLMCMIFVIKSNYINYKTFIASMIFLLLCAANILYAFALDSSSLSYNITNTVKMIIPFVVYYYFSNFDCSENIKKIMNFFSWFYPLSLIFTMFLNIGFSTYGDIYFGNKGFYFAGNEISSIMIIMFAYSFQDLTIKHSLLSFIKLIMTLIATLAIGTKTAYIGIACIFLAVIISNINTKKNLLKIIIVIFIAAMAGIVVFINMKDYVNEIIQFMKLRYNYYIKGKYSNEILTYLLSTRNSKLSNIFSYYSTEGSLLGFLIGMGAYHFSINLPLMTEMDIFDMLFWYGLVFCILYLGCLINFYIKNRKNFQTIEKGVLLVTLMISILSGHIIFAPSVTITIVIYLIWIRGNKYEKAHSADN